MYRILILIAAVILVVFGLVPQVMLYFSADLLTKSVRNDFDRMYILGGDVEFAVARAKALNPNNLEDVKSEYEAASTKLDRLTEVAVHELDVNAGPEVGLDQDLAELRAQTEKLLSDLKSKASFADVWGDIAAKLSDEFKLAFHQTLTGWGDLLTKEEERRKKTMDWLNKIRWRKWADIQPGLSL